MSRLGEVLLPECAAALRTGPGGYSDVLGMVTQIPPAHSLAQRAMRTRAYATVYQTIRPLGRILLGGIVRQQGREADRKTIAGHLQLRPGSTVFDIGCGPGNFTGWFGEAVGPTGLAVGLDASEQMLSRAVQDNVGPSVEYLRAGAEALPFADHTADAVSCLAALYLFNAPERALSEMMRVLKPGGRLVVLTSLGPSIEPIRRAGEFLGGARLFARDEVTGILAGLGAIDIEQQIQGVTQTVIASARR